MKYFYAFVFTITLGLGQPRTGKGPEPTEANLRDAIQRWSDGQRFGADPGDRAGRFAVAHEDVAIPILIDAIKVRLHDKQALNKQAQIDKDTEYFIAVVVDLITYNASSRGIDAVVELCRIDELRCPRLVTTLLNQAAAQGHSFRTVYEVVDGHQSLRTFVLPWVAEATSRDPWAVRMLARELLKREQDGHPISDHDVILSGLQPTIRATVGEAVLTERLEQNRQLKK